MGEGVALREALAPEGRSGTPEVHAHSAIFGASAWPEGGRASARALWRIVVVLDGHQRGMRSTYLTAAAFCKPPSPVSQISR
jgi:hypothetical protein